MKVIVTSTDAIIDKRTGDFFPGILESLISFKKLINGNEVMVLSGHADNLEKIPKELNPVNINIKFRGSNYPIEVLMKTFPQFGDRSKILILAANDADLKTASNSKVLLLSAYYAKSNNESSIAFNYGIRISTIDSLNQFFERFSNINNPWYFSLTPNNNFSSYALINANGMGFRSVDAFDISGKFQQCIKQGAVTYREVFAKYFMMSLYQIVSVMEQVDIWAIYPSSASSNNPDLEYFKDLARTAFNKRAVVPLLVRHTATHKRHDTKKDARLRDGCDSQFSSIHLDPYYKSKIKGSTVCIIDDFTTFGSSSETARNLLLAAGAKKIIFISLGKFGKEYYQFNYELKGDLFQPGYSYNRIGTTFLNGAFNSYADGAMLDSLKGIV